MPGRLTGITILPVNYEKIASLWLCESKHEMHNVLHTAVMWVLWKTRNDICFNKTPWTGMQVLWRRLVSALAQWVILLSEAAIEQMSTLLLQLERIARSHPLLTWRDPG